MGIKATISDSKKGVDKAEVEFDIYKKYFDRVADADATIKDIPFGKTLQTFFNTNFLAQIKYNVTEIFS